MTCVQVSLTQSSIFHELLVVSKFVMKGLVYFKDSFFLLLGLLPESPYFTTFIKYIFIYWPCHVFSSETRFL